MTASLRTTGIGLVGPIPWGTHFCHFFETKEDLLDAILPFFKAGLEAREFCLWVVAEPLTEEEARNALRRIVPELDRFLADGSIEIHRAREWYLSAGAIDLRRLLDAWDQKLAQAVHNGFAGMRANASEAWLQEEHWRDFSAYEEKLNEWIADKRMVVFCSYPLATGRAAAILDVARTHNFAMARRNGAWQVVETVNGELRARNRQQSAAAALGRAAIRSRDLAALLDEATAVTAETLGTDFAALGEWLPGGEGFALRAGVGWKDGLVGSTIGADDASMAAYMSGGDEPVIVADVRAESRLGVSRVALEHGVVTAMGVVVRGGSGPWGVLAVYSKRPRAFGPDDVGFLQSVATVLSLAVERHEVEVAQRREKETLQAIFDNIPVMISFNDASGRLLRVNREWERTLGWTTEDWQRVDHLADVFPDPERRAEVLQFIQRAESRWVDFKPRTRDGRVVETSWARIALSDGRLIGLGLDITERKRAEEERARLLESESRLRAEAEAALERLRAIQSITDAALSRLGLDDLLRELLARLRSTLRAEVAAVLLIDDERKEPYTRAIDGVPLACVARVRIPLDAVHLGAPLLMNDVEPPAPGRDDWYAKVWAALKMPLRAGMSTPLLVEGKPIGIVGVTSTHALFTEDDLRLLQVVADRVAPAIERGTLVETVGEGRRRLAALSQRLVEVQEIERREIARELHDEVGQLLTGLLFRIEGHGAAAGNPKDEMKGIVNDLIHRVRDLSMTLRPPMLDDLGLLAALMWQIDRFEAQTGISVRFHHADLDRRFGAQVEITVFRIVQEALTNVARHAGVKHVSVDLWANPICVGARIEDEGRGFDVEAALAARSSGLEGMRERSRLANGRLTLESAPGQGASLTVVLPLDPARLPKDDEG